MLASPVESAEEALSYFENAAVEDKYDGIRAHAHISGGEVRLFSRTRDEITESFPELPPALVGLPQDAILDGEIVAWSFSRPCGAGTSAREGRALPFSTLQQRLGRKKVSEKMLRDIPVAYLVFDVLYAGTANFSSTARCASARILTIFANRQVAQSTHVGADALVRAVERSSAATAAGTLNPNSPSPFPIIAARPDPPRSGFRPRTPPTTSKHSLPPPAPAATKA